MKLALIYVIVVMLLALALAHHRKAGEQSQPQRIVRSS